VRIVSRRGSLVNASPRETARAVTSPVTVPTSFAKHHGLSVVIAPTWPVSVVPTIAIPIRGVALVIDRHRSIDVSIGRISSLFVVAVGIFSVDFLTASGAHYGEDADGERNEESAESSGDAEHVAFMMAYLCAHARAR
jgi:hypothetical protein